MNTRSFAAWSLVVFLTAGFLLSGCLVDGKIADKTWNDYVGPHRHDVQLPNYKLHYIDIGEGEPVFMVHGFASSGYAWNNNAQYLQEAGFRIIMVDLPGQGFSPVPPKDFSPKVENIAASVIELADHLKIDRFSIVGASMGGGVTLFLTWKYPDRVKRATVIDPACFPMKVPTLLRAMNAPVVGAAVTQMAGRWSVQVAMQQNAYRDEVVTDTFVDEYARPMAKPGFRQYIARLANEFQSEEGLAMVDTYDRIQRPLLIIWGAHDSWVPPEFGPRLQALVPNSRLVPVEDAGHMPHIEQPQIVNPLLVEFLREQ